MLGSLVSACLLFLALVFVNDLAPASQNNGNISSQRAFLPTAAAAIAALIYC